MRAESHLREEPWDSGLSHAILNPLGATAACEAFFFFLGESVPQPLGGRWGGGACVQTRTQLMNHLATLSSDGADWGPKTSKFANCRGSALFLHRQGWLKFPRPEIQSLSNHI